MLSKVTGNFEEEEGHSSFSDDDTSLDTSCMMETTPAVNSLHRKAPSSRKDLLSRAFWVASVLVLFALATSWRNSAQATDDSHGRNLEVTSDRDLDSTPLVYSKMATIVPDPFHPVSKQVLEDAKQKYGSWHFWDGDEATRPTDDYCAKFPNRDVTEFPDTAWQNDAVFVNHYLNDAEELVSRTMEAIYTEYGWGISQWPEDKKTWVLKERAKLGFDILDTLDVESDQFKDLFATKSTWGKRGNNGHGGWTTKRSFDGLVRRLLHAMNTNDEFVVVMGGHSSAAGHGNHFHQSYMMQFHKVMAPVFARLGVKLVTRNLAQGGLGTIQSAMGMKDIYGDSIDILLWDSAMTEGSRADIEYFLRQGVLSGKKVPLLWGGEIAVLEKLHNVAEADVGFFGNGMDAIREVTDDDQAKSIPYAARFMKCAHGLQDLCKDRFCATCWIDRDDVPRESFEKLQSKPGSQVRWHAGWREHQLRGRVLALAILDALLAAIQIWSDGTQGGPPLDEGEWHVTEYYENIRNKLRNIDPSEKTWCADNDDRFPARLCSTAMQSRTTYTPRANPHETSLLNLIKGPEEKRPKQTMKPLYDGPDLPNECFATQEGEVDVLAVAGARRYLVSAQDDQPVEGIGSRDDSRMLGKDDISLGSGWELIQEKPGDCDGTYNSICSRHYLDPCPMYGHHDSRGAILGDEKSGWLVLNIPKIEEGLLIAKLTALPAPKHKPKKRRSLLREPQAAFEVSIEAEDTTERDYIDDLGHNSHRRLDMVGLPDTFQFDYAIAGKVTTLNKEQFIDKIHAVQRVVEILVLIDDPNYGTKENVEVGIRIRGCGEADCSLQLTHIYWA